MFEVYQLTFFFKLKFTCETYHVKYQRILYKAAAPTQLGPVAKFQCMARLGKAYVGLADKKQCGAAI